MIENSIKDIEKYVRNMNQMILFRKLMHGINKHIFQYEIKIYLQNVMHHAQSMNHDAAFQNLFYVGTRFTW